jgi:hypothetical protein
MCFRLLKNSYALLGQLSVCRTYSSNCCKYYTYSYAWGKFHILLSYCDVSSTSQLGQWRCRIGDTYNASQRYTSHTLLHLSTHTRLLYWRVQLYWHSWRFSFVEKVRGQSTAVYYYHQRQVQIKIMDSLTIKQCHDDVALIRQTYTLL